MTVNGYPAAGPRGSAQSEAGGGKLARKAADSAPMWELGNELDAETEPEGFLGLVYRAIVCTIAVGAVGTVTLSSWLGFGGTVALVVLLVAATAGIFAVRWLLAA